MIEGRDVRSTRGVVAAGPAGAARAGVGVLEHGGNAMDAAAAACMACGMLQPAATGIGGYVLAAVVLEGRTGRILAMDADATAPAAAHDRMFEIMPARDGRQGINEKEYLCSVRDDANLYGPLAVATPGLMAGVGTLWARWGRLPWADIVAPSRALLSDGFPFGDTANAIRNMERVIRRFEPTARHLMPEGRLPAPEDVWHRPDMEKTLARLASAGWRDFYEGELGRKIVDYLQRTGGMLTYEDMTSYEPRVTEPYAGAYRHAAVYGPILPNGCLSSIQILNMLDCLEPAASGTVEYWHRLAEVLKRAWRDRLRYLGDPAFVDVPVERLLSKDYAAGRVETLRQFPDYVDTLVPPPPGVSDYGTLHISTADADGNLVAATITHGAAFGSCLTVPGTGVILGHGMSRLDPRPGFANSIAPRKRPLNNVAPMILRMPERDVATGVPGGRRIVSVGAQLARYVIEDGATSYQAAAAPRMHVQTHEPLEITESAGDRIIEALRRMGHSVEAVRNVAGGAHCAEVLKKEGGVRAGGNTRAAGVE